MSQNELYALLLTVAAGISTVIGSLIALFAKRTNTKFLAASLGFSAGVMIYVSMVEIFSKSREYLEAQCGVLPGNIWAASSFFAGIFLIGMIDYFVPSAEGDIGSHPSGGTSVTLEKAGIMTALAIAVHNFPEGLVTFTSSLKDLHLGVMIAIALAIHNIPEGIATSLPIFYATGDRKKAFKLSLLSGLTEPFGAVIGYAFLRPFMNDAAIGVLFGMIAGIMMFISLEELLPMAREYEKSKATILSVILGMAIMAVSLILFL